MTVDYVGFSQGVLDTTMPLLKPPSLVFIEPHAVVHPPSSHPTIDGWELVADVSRRSGASGREVVARTGRSLEWPHLVMRHNNGLWVRICARYLDLGRTLSKVEVDDVAAAYALEKALTE